ncbi:hypothetical protein FA95DRAFT_1614314, partial [Auriscalpium vulgare]
SPHALLDVLSSEFPDIASARPLFELLQEAGPNLDLGQPSPELTAFLERIESADPNAPDLKEENKNESWGHYQFTAGSLTCDTVFTSWSAVGNPRVACQLIAGAVRTCKVARSLCFLNKVEPKSYLSDVYLEHVIEKLYKTAQDAAPRPVPSHEAHEVNENETESPHDPDPKDHEQLRTALLSLTKDELKQWCASHAIDLPRKAKVKNDIVSVLLDSPDAAPSRDDIGAIIKERKAKKAQL